MREFQVQVNPELLLAHQVTMTDVLEAARQATGVRGAGFREDANQRSILRVELQVRSAAELGEAVVTTSQGTPVRLRNVARVVEQPSPSSATPPSTASRA